VDKSASTVDNAPPRRSTESLDAHMAPIIFWLAVNAVVLASCYASFRWVAPIGLRFFGLSQYANGAQLIPLLLIGVGSVVLGFVVGMFAVPVLLRPFVRPARFWALWGRSGTINVLGLSAPLKLWYRLLYGSAHV